MSKEMGPQTPVLRAYCPDCTHYANHGTGGGGTPPWPTCAFRLHPDVCGRFKDHGRPAYGWQPPSEKKRRAAALQVLAKATGASS